MINKDSIPSGASKTPTGRTYAGLNPQQRKSLRSKQFLQAGLEIFGSNGYRAATVRSLCKEAKLTDRYFYESFGSLEKLIMEVYEQCMSEIKSDILDAIKQEYPKNGAQHAIKAGLLTFFSALEDPQVARICLVELEGISTEVNTLYYRYINNFAEMLVELANLAYPFWELNKSQKRMVGISLIGAARQAATDWFVSGYKMDKDNLVSATAYLFICVVDSIKYSQIHHHELS